MAPVMLWSLLWSLLWVLVLGVGQADAHPLKLDDLGCHNDRQSSYYHCHEGVLEGRQFARKSSAKRAIKKLQQQQAVVEAAKRVVVPLSPVAGAPQLFGPYEATLVKLADGVLELDVHLWPGLVQRAVVGLAGIYVPRLGGDQCEAKAATKAREFTQDWLGDGSALTVSQVQREDDSGRMLVRLSRDGDDLGTALLAAGHGREGAPAPWCAP